MLFGGQPRFAGAPLAAPGPPVCLVPGQPLPSWEDEKGASGTWVWHRDEAGRAPLAGCAQFCVTPSPSAGRRCAGPAVPARTAGARPLSEAPLQAAGTPPADVSNGASSERMGGWLTELQGHWRTVSGATAKQDAPNHTVGLSRGAHGPHQAPGTSAQASPLRGAAPAPGEGTPRPHPSGPLALHPGSRAGGSECRWHAGALAAAGAGRLSPGCARHQGSGSRRGFRCWAPKSTEPLSLSCLSVLGTGQVCFLLCRKVPPVRIW